MPYPPGPRALPVVGNVLDMPQSRFALTWTRFGEKYGPLTWLTVPGQNILVINSFEAAKELLETRPLLFADRPRFTMLTQLLGLGDYAVFNGYNSTWKKQRAHLKQSLSASVVKRDYSSLFEANAQQYLGRCLVCPEDCVVGINRIVAETVVKFAYGRLGDEQGRDYIQLNNRITDIITLGLQGYVVDLFPSLRYLPSWLPGMKFKRDAARWRQEIRQQESTVFESAKASTLSNDPEVVSSFVFKKLQELYDKHNETNDPKQLRDEEMTLARSALAIFIGGVETTQNTTESFVCAMALSPLVQKKAQDEIDRVIGSGRFPTFNDQQNLPYIHAVVLETLRWHPVASSGVPHASRQDDTFSGYFIPKGTTAIVNAWGISRDSKYYPNPSVFDPERHLRQPPELDPREFVFGFGRRTCPGKDLAFQQVWIMVASILWAFRLVGDDDLSLVEDANRFSLSSLSQPMPFKCTFIPRREGLEARF